MSEQTSKQIIDLIKRSNKILVMPSSPPDGDSLGSAIALYLSLKKIDKEVTVVCNDPVPEVLQFLPNSAIIGNKVVSSNDFIITLNTDSAQVDTIKSVVQDDKINIIITPKKGRFSQEEITFSKGEVEYDLIITVDCAELTQLGDLYENNTEMFYQIPVVNIDHHISNTQFGRINYVDIMSSSTTEMLLEILKDLSKEYKKDLIDEDIATLLLTGIITDTGSFQNANTTPKAFGKAAELISYGARQQEIIQHIYKTKQLSQLKLWGRVLSKIQTDDKYKIVWSVVSQQDFKDTESAEEQTGDIIDELMTNAPGAEIVLLMKEKSDGAISVSVRTTTPTLDASKFAENFGGGGHTQAAGFRIHNTSLMDAEYKVIQAVRELQTERLGIIAEIEKAHEEKAEPNKPIINVEELIYRAQEAQKATDMISQVEQKSEEKPPQPEKPTPPAQKPQENQKEQAQEQPKKRKRKRKRKSQKPEEAKKETGFSIKTPLEGKTNEPKEVELQPGNVYKFED